MDQLPSVFRRDSHPFPDFEIFRNISKIPNGSEHRWKSIRSIADGFGWLPRVANASFSVCELIFCDIFARPRTLSRSGHIFECHQYPNESGEAKIVQKIPSDVYVKLRTHGKLSLVLDGSLVLRVLQSSSFRQLPSFFRRLLNSPAISKRFRTSSNIPGESEQVESDQKSRGWILVPRSLRMSSFGSTSLVFLTGSGIPRVFEAFSNVFEAPTEPEMVEIEVKYRGWSCLMTLVLDSCVFSLVSLLPSGRSNLASFLFVL